MKVNYHTHTTRCHHAIGSDEDYVRSAIEAGFDELGFSDHTPWRYGSDFVSHMRMKLDKFQDYKQSVLSLKEKYRDQISIKLGLEVEFFPQYMSWLRDFLKQEQLDYIIFGNHYYLTDEKRVYFGTACVDEQYLELYCRTCIEGMESGLYSYLCHPELFMRAYPRFDHRCESVAYRICEAAKLLNIPLEYNLAGAAYNEINHVSEYPHPRFWEIAKEVGNTAIIGSDAHHFKDLANPHYWDKAQHYLDDVLQIKRIERLEFKGF